MRLGGAEKERKEKKAAVQNEGRKMVEVRHQCDAVANKQIMGMKVDESEGRKECERCKGID